MTAAASLAPTFAALGDDTRWGILVRLGQASVSTIEIVEGLGKQARATLARLGYTNVDVRIGDG